MAGRSLRPEATFAGGPYDHPSFARRRAVLRETVAALEPAHERARLRAVAAANLARWRATSRPPDRRISVSPEDWGVVAARVVREHGAPCAVLNMANAYVPGGGYVEGCPAQEENLFRRTDCHFSLAPGLERYPAATTALLEGREGRVYLDLGAPRVCVRGPEELGYPWLPEREVFPFFELRAAAQDLRDGRPFDREEARRRVAAQLDTLVDGGVRFAVLSAFGCGAFRNPAQEVAGLYAELLAERREAFDHVAFAVYYPGYGPDNHGPFARRLGQPPPPPRGGG